MRKLQNDYMTDEERKLKSFSRKNLMTLSNWHEWQAADRLHGGRQIPRFCETRNISRSGTRIFHAPGQKAVESSLERRTAKDIGTGSPEIETGTETRDKLSMQAATWLYPAEHNGWYIAP